MEGGQGMKDGAGVGEEDGSLPSPSFFVFERFCSSSVSPVLPRSPHNKYRASLQCGPQVRSLFLPV